MRRMTYFVMALALLLGLAQCRKEQPQLQSEGVRITLNVENGGASTNSATDGAKAEVVPPGVNFVEGDTILVASNGKYVGYLVHNGTTFTGNITDPVVGEPLYFYFLGNKIKVSTLTAGTTDGCIVNISDQTGYPALPVISMGVSIDRSNHNAIVDYSSGTTHYEAQLHNKASLMKFNVTTPTNSPICITGMNNQVTVNFNALSENDGFSYGKADANGVIMMKGGAGTDVEKWAVVLPTVGATPEGEVYTYDGYKGIRPAISEPIAANQYLSGGIAITVNTLDMKYSALTFEAKTAGATVTFTKGSNFSGTVQYSTDGSAWDNYTSAITLASAGDKVMFRGDNSAYYNGSASQFSCSADCYIYGNIMSLVNSTGYPTATSVGSTAFREMFKNNTHIKSHNDKNLILPATTLGHNCYAYMFQGCTGLTMPPVILATTLAGDSNCKGMFDGCISLISAPELHVTTLQNYCFQNMFKGCTNLTTVPANLLPATTLKRGCYESMFEGCTSLTNVPNLPATSLSERCYFKMFYGCTSLATIPAGLLPATSLADAIKDGDNMKGCYESMFRGCTNLTSVPNLPATTLKERCYANMFRESGLTTVPADMLCAITMAKESCASMFRECPNLTNTPTIAATTLGEACCDAMFYQSSKITLARPLHATTLVENCYKSLFNGCTSLTSVTCYATDISASDCTTSWLNSVGANGTLTTPSTTNWTENSPNGIPSGWTRVNVQ